MIISVTMYLDLYSFTFGALSAGWMYFVWKFLSRSDESSFSSSDSTEESSSEDTSHSDEEFLSALDKCFDKATELMGDDQSETFQKIKDETRNCFTEKDPKEFIRKAA
jgi:hypothetical protein